MIVFHECLALPVQTSLVEHDHMIQALAANGTDHTCHVSTLSAELNFGRLAAVTILSRLSPSGSRCG
jgi:hypothetical protein